MDMSAIEWDDWGGTVVWDANAGNWDNAYFHTIIPAFPACTFWEDDPETHSYHRLRGRVLCTVPDPVAKEYEFELWFRYGSGEIGEEGTMVKKPLVEMTEEWSDKWPTCAGYDSSYETSAHNAKSSQGYKASTAMPYFELNAGVAGCSNADDTDEVDVYGFQFGVEHSAANTDRPMELFDYSNGDMFASQASASSAIVSQAGLTAYNRITYYATWQLAFAYKG